MLNILYFLLFLFLPFHGNSTQFENLIYNPPAWMLKQIKQDLGIYKEKKVSLKKLNRLYQNKADQWLLVKFIIEDEFVFFATRVPKDHFLYHRVSTYYNFIVMLAQYFHLPNMEFLISMADGLESQEIASEGIPIFAMCKSAGIPCILIPDFEALNQRYQVLANIDITQFEFPWESKAPTMVWRGSTAQGAMITNQNLHQLSRVKLCELSYEQPDLIDAKFTIFAQLVEPIPRLEQLRGETISFEDQLKYKYQILIDGNASSYSASGWKFFTNSLIFKPDSRWTQWYYSQLQPWVHYIPVEANLSDLADKIQWARQNDSQAKSIAKNARDFALAHLAHLHSLAYLYLALLKYSKLNFKNK